MKNVEANSFVTSYLEAWNERDASSVTEHLCPNGRYIDEVFQQQIGREALFEELVDYFQSDHYFYEVTGDILTNGKTIAFQYCAKPMAPDSQTTIWHGAEFITLRGNSALEIRDYYQARVSLPRSQRGDDAARYVKSGLREDAMAQLLEALECLMVERQLYLDPDLSLPKLADYLDTTVNHVSQAINAGLQTTFFDYINQKRVEAAIKLMQSDTSSREAILDIALEVGFNSTSTFYNAFRKVTGQTPGAYRQRILSEA
jgi:AraC-like DNA-binding protein